MKIDLSNKKKIVIKVGSSTLTHESGLLNIRKIENLVKCIADIQNSGKHIILVSSGAISCGIAKLGFYGKSLTTVEKQAAASVGQCELIDIYDRNFLQYGHKIGQILMTKDIVDDKVRRESASGTFMTLLEYGCIPVVNENDTLSSEQITFGGNDTLAISVARLVKADLIINMSDVDGFYDRNPRTNPDAKLIEHIPEITEYHLSCAEGTGSGSKRGTGGMKAKLEAAMSAIKHDIPMIIVNGSNPNILYNIFDGEFTGTYFGKL
ncbi:MAG: glutamate 5-kinase [Clostridiales bacterium]|jgi:glutamate 5-kinase|nr:glutamate 5-kinase [Clostridiales bacterium]